MVISDGKNLENLLAKLFKKAGKKNVETRIKMPYYDKKLKRSFYNEYDIVYKDSILGLFESKTKVCEVKHYSDKVNSELIRNFCGKLKENKISTQDASFYSTGSYTIDAISVGMMNHIALYDELDMMGLYYKTLHGKEKFWLTGLCKARIKSRKMILNLEAKYREQGEYNDSSSREYRSKLKERISMVQKIDSKAMDKMNCFSSKNKIPLIDELIEDYGKFLT